MPNTFKLLCKLVRPNTSNPLHKVTLLYATNCPCDIKEFLNVAGPIARNWLQNVELLEAIKDPWAIVLFQKVVFP